MTVALISWSTHLWDIILETKIDFELTTWESQHSICESQLSTDLQLSTCDLQLSTCDLKLKTFSQLHLTACHSHLPVMRSLASMEEKQKGSINTECWNKNKAKSKNYSTHYSQVVSHPSTKCASVSLTSEIERGPVYANVYGHSWKWCFIFGFSRNSSESSGGDDDQQNDKFHTTRSYCRDILYEKLWVFSWPLKSGKRIDFIDWKLGQWNRPNQMTLGKLWGNISPAECPARTWTLTLTPRMWVCGGDSIVESSVSESVSSPWQILRRRWSVRTHKSIKRRLNLSRS